MKLFHTVITLPLLSLVMSAAAFADDMQDTVVSKGASIVVNSSGNCVRTKWQSSNDVCAPQKAEVAPAPVVAPPPPPPAPRVEIGQDQRTVYFDFNKAKLRTDSVEKLDGLVALIQGNTQITQITVHGFADKIGQDKYNAVLSEKRAEAVRAYLAGKLSIPTNADVRGLGVSKTADCDKIKKRAKRIECLAPDRRVEVELTYKK